MIPTVFSEYLCVMPELFLCIWAMIVLLACVFQKTGERDGVYYMTLVGLGLAVVILSFTYHQAELFPEYYSMVYIFNDLYMISPFTQLMKGIIVLTVGAVHYMTFKHFQREALDRFEYPVLMLLSCVGMMIMVSANDLISVFVGLEMQSFCLYVMVAFARENYNASEAGVKYFVLGALASAFFLFGASYLYGFTGTTEFNGIAAILQSTSSVPLPLAISLVMILVALAFKISLAPFHMWAPDVYEGSPTPTTALIASAPKIAGFALVLNFISHIYGHHMDLWLPLVASLAVLSIFVGAFAALFQKKILRLLAYSSISHMGFAMLGFLRSDAIEYENIFNYLIIYVIMSVGFFAAFLSLRKRGQLLETIDDLTGLSKAAPFIALCMTILLFSFAGVPPFAGFFAKIAVIKGAISSQYFVTAVLAVIGSVISAAFYIRVIKAMYFDEPVGGEHTLALDKAIPRQTMLILVATTAIVTFYVLAPNLFGLEIGKYLVS